VRVTDSMIFQNAAASTARAREAAERAQVVASTGVRVSQPGDDPTGAGQLVAYKLSGDRLSAISKAAGAASDELASADSALGDVGTALSRARELAVQLSSSEYSADQLSSGAQQVSGLVSQILSDLNTRVGNRYIFGGTQDATPPWDAATASYLGDAGVRQVEIAPGVTEQANVRTDVAIGGSGGGVDVIATLQSLQSALQAGDSTAVRGTLDALDQSISQVATARAQAGVQMNAFDAAVSATKLAADHVTAASSKISDADVIDANIQLQATQTALQASLTATAQSFKLSLMDYLR
jgi:flagellar hook-associated protein 3 FlgL